MPDTATACPQCGAAVQQTPQPAAPPPASGTPPTPSAPQGQPPLYSGQPQESSGQATASLVLGILSVTCLGIFAGIPAVILGHIAKSNIRKSAGRMRGDGKATAGLIMGYISIALIPIMLAIAIPSLLRARMAANESAAMSTLRTVNTSQIEYTTNYNAGFARDLATLGPGPSGTCEGQGTQEHACLVDRVLGNSSCTAGNWCVKTGFEYSMSAVCGAQGCTEYVIVARPATQGSTGTRSFCSTSDSIIRSRIGARLASPPTVEECQSWNPIY
jgi:type IV pilus assembly protein PilA